MLRHCNLPGWATPACAVLWRRDPSRHKADVACLGRNALLALEKAVSRQ